MSGTLLAHEPVCKEGLGGAIELLIESRPRDIGGFSVRRTLPSMRRRLVGPFAFFDHMGPVDLAPGSGIGPGAFLPIDDTHDERAIYVVEGAVGCEATSLKAGTLAVLRPGATVTLTAEGAARVMIVGGARLTGERHIEWNFVSSSKERIDQAKRDWKEGRFPKVPGDEIEYVPLPEKT